MNNTKEQVFQLFVEKLSGSISLEEEHALEERLGSDPIFQREWERLEEKASELGMHAFLSELDAAADLEELKALRPSAADRGRRIGYRKVMAVAAVVLLAVAG